MKTELVRPRIDAETRRAYFFFSLGISPLSDLTYTAGSASDRTQYHPDRSCQSKGVEPCTQRSTCKLTHSSAKHVHFRLGMLFKHLVADVGAKCQVDASNALTASFNPLRELRSSRVSKSLHRNFVACARIGNALTRSLKKIQNVAGATERDTSTPHRTDLRQGGVQAYISIGEADSCDIGRDFGPLNGLKPEQQLHPSGSILARRGRQSH